MALIRFEPFDPVSNLLGVQRELERFLRNPGFSTGPSGWGAFPPVNILQDSDGVVVIVEAPGVQPSDLSISGQGNTLTISGERKREAAAEQKGFHRRERAFGKFSRSLQLADDLDMSKATAAHQAGVLTIRIPRSEATKPRQIAVQAA
jgi:HSP20 family protein